MSAQTGRGGRVPEDDTIEDAAMKNSDDNQLLTRKEAAAELRISIRTLYDLINAGELRVVKVGQRKTFVRRADLNSYIESAVVAA